MKLNVETILTLAPLPQANLELGWLTGVQCLACAVQVREPHLNPPTCINILLAPCLRGENVGNSHESMGSDVVREPAP